MIACCALLFAFAFVLIPPFLALLFTLSFLKAVDKIGKEGTGKNFLYIFEIIGRSSSVLARWDGGIQFLSLSHQDFGMEKVE